MARDPVYQPVIRVALGLFASLRLRITITGQELAPRTGGAVVAINHIGYLDFALAGVPFWYGGHRLVRFMAKHEVFAHPVAGPLMRGMRHIPVDRSAGADAYEAAVAALAAGELVGVFPEATISRSWCLKEFKTGAVRMAQAADVPVVPLVIWGSHRVLTKGRPRALRAARGTPITLVVGEPMPMPAGADPAALTAELQARMAAMLDEAQRTYPVDASGAPWWLPARLGGSAPTPAEAAELDAAETAARAARRAVR
jgi:1-acyl-sn-glycerol-3-phosphate acyltransferase